jgi:glycosyltransferase involved in cell wall biosynthesis
MVVMPVAPLVSVVTPFFNAGRFIRDAVDSVLAQTYGNWELLLVDDGSTDDGAARVHEYVRRHADRIRCLEHPGHANRGMTSSRNLAVRQSRGKYLAFLDADDVWLPHKLDAQVAILEEHDEAVMVFGRPLYWRSWTSGADAKDTTPELWVDANSVVHPPRMLSVSYPLGPGGAPCPSDLLVRRECVEVVGGFEESFIRVPRELFEDQAFLAKVYLIGGVFVADATWTKYRLHDDQCVAVVKRAGQYHHARRYYLRWLEQYLRSVSNVDSGIQQQLADALRRAGPKQVRWTRRLWRRLKNRLAARRMLLRGTRS